MTIWSRLAAVLFGLAVLPLFPAAGAQEARNVVPPPAQEEAEPATGLEDILRRQEALQSGRDPRDFEATTQSGPGESEQLGPLGGASDALAWESLRFGTADVRVSAGGPVARTVIQDRGVWWWEFRQGPLLEYGGWSIVGIVALLAVFYLLRGRIRIGAGRSGQTITRFNAFERFSHWLLAGSFILLGLTGLIVLFGRKGLLPWMGPEAYATLALWSKWIHNNVSWAFMIGLVLVLVLWLVHNIPNRTDLVWFAKGGGIIGKAHPPAKKFNGGQKIIFWSVVILGGSISASGLSLLFPFELPMFAKTFAIMNDIGVPGWLGMEAFPTRLSPQEEMQFAQLWHAIVAFAMIVIIIAHIYIGTIGMEGAFDAMGSGEVDLNWAKEHHSLWVEEVARKQAQHTPSAAGGATPAE